MERLSPFRVGMQGRTDREDALGVAAVQAPSIRADQTTTLPPTRKGSAENIVSDYTQTAVASADPGRMLEHRIVAMAENEPAATAYKVLRTHVLQRMRTNGWKSLAITSPRDGNGKTLTAVNLAISLARHVAQTILLVDLDLRRPSLAGHFFAEPRPGLSDYITDDFPIEDILVNPGIERLVLLPGNHSFTHSSEALCSPRMIALVEELTGRYPDRLVLFDMPPVLAGDDVIAFLPHLESVLLVIEEGRTTKDELLQACNLLGEDKLLGTVLNKSDDSSIGIGYY